MITEFPLLVPESFAARIKPDDPNDPLLLQILPQACELQEATGYGPDPIDEAKYSPVPGVVRKYPGRVLLLATNICAMNCRFCFRRHSQEKITDWRRVFSYLQDDPTINEVILSGGDPLMLKPEALHEIMEQLAVIPHIKKIRIHSRVPIAMPERITADLIRPKIQTILIIHCNHPQEINAEVAQALAILHKRGITIFNQSVLLRGINDDSDVLTALSEKLFSVGVIPCYLHLLDQVQGAAHFYVEMARAKQIYNEMKEKLSGYLMPKLVIEVQGKKKYV